jgi:hypothetical protein
MEMSRVDMDRATVERSRWMQQMVKAVTAGS